MAIEHTSNTITFQATAVAIEAFVRVKLDSNGLVSAAGEGDLVIGTTMQAFAASGYGTVKLVSGGGTFLIQAAGPITCGKQLYAAAAGEVDDSGTYKAAFVACESCTAQGDVIECALLADAVTATNSFGAEVGTIAAAGNSAATATQVLHRIEVVSDADATKGVRLPVPSAGLECIIYSSVGTHVLKVYPSTGGTINDGVVDAAVSCTARRQERFLGTSATNWICALL